MVLSGGEAHKPSTKTDGPPGGESRRQNLATTRCEMNSRHTKRLGVDEKKDMLHTFQIRFDVPSGEEFLFNIYTGETVMTEDREHMIVDRYASTWRKREPPQDGKKSFLMMSDLKTMVIN